MAGMSELAVKVFGEYQRLLINTPNATHESVIKDLMTRANGQEEVAAVLELIENHPLT